MKYLINGAFLCRNLTGIERFSFEICKNIDSLVPNDYLGIYIPNNAINIPDYTNIKIFTSKKPLKSFPIWDMFTFKKACKKLQATGINFGNTAPLGKHAGICFLHDIYPALFPEDFTSFKDKLIRFYSCFHYKNICRNALRIFTVSEYSKSQICNYYNVSESQINVIPNGWNHFSNIDSDDTIFGQFSVLTKGQYFFTLGSLQKRKNLKWLSSYAEKHPESIFAISGKAISGMVSNEIQKLQTLSNVILLGYVSDSKVKSLMHNCKAFIFPSYYEGFGIPPLEALSVGAKIIVSNAACLPEIYGDSAYYIDPSNTDCNLDELLSKPVSKPDAILEKYTYKNAAELLYASLQQK